MAVIKKDDLISRLTAFIGEEQNDDAISLMEDVSDTLGDYESKINDTTDWKQKYEENDKAWRNKYVTRFTQGVISEDPEEEEEEEKTPPRTYNELFSIKE